MHRKIVLSTAVCLLTLVLLAVQFSFPAFAVDNETTYTATNSGLSGDDNYTGPIALGFDFDFFGTTRSQAFININGTLNFDSGFSGYSNSDLSGAGPDNTIYAFWDDLITNGQTIYYNTVGTAGSRKFIVQWTNMYFFSNPSLPMGTFQVVLYEGSNVIQIQYRDLLGGAASQGQSSTVGIKQNSSNYVQYFNNSPTLSLEQAITYTPNGSGYNVNYTGAYDPVYLLPAGAPGGATLINPLNNSTNVTVTPTFEWLPVDLATSYRLLISTQNDFASLVVNQTGITGTSYTLGSALDLSTVYYWKIESINSSGSTFSSTRTFTTASTLNTVPDAPQNLLPALLTQSNRINQTTLGSNSFNFDLADSDAGQQLRYRFQISADAAFTDIKIDYRSTFAAAGGRSFTFGENTGTYLTGTSSTSLPDGTYYVRLRTEDDASASSSWTADTDSAFILDNTAPDALAAPVVVGSATPALTNISWAATSDSYPANPSYRLEMSQDAGFASSTSATTNLTAYSMTSLAYGTWYVRVFVSDNAGNESLPSVAASFSLVAPSPTPTPSPTPSPSPSAAPSTPYYAPPTQSLPTPTPTPTEVVPGPRLEKLIVQVVDEAGTPLPNVKVTLYSDIQVGYTDANGYVTFKDVLEGRHRLVAELNGAISEKTIQVSADTRVLETSMGLPLSVTKTSGNASQGNTGSGPNWGLIVFVVLGIASVTLVFISTRRKKEDPVSQTTFTPLTGKGFVSRPM